jgi:4-diphosphocytidyl-2-C-methyl-D-erythritol kinase
VLMPRLKLTAPAKINLFLHINHRRQDGYHELQTFFQLLDFGDELTFDKLQDYSGDKLVWLESSLAGVPDSANLICKASEALVKFAYDQEYSNSLFPVKINLTKRLPMGGGLGGGSSDAATTLLALNYLWKLNISNQQLAELGTGLGADVAVFVRGHSAYAEGIGELLQPRQIPERWYLVIHPNCHVSTAEVFNHKELTRDTPKSKIAPALEGDPGDLAMGRTNADNDCQAVVCKLYPEISEAMIWLNQFSPARLTGTGACIFTCFTEKERAHHALSQLPANYTGFVARGINKSPVYDALEAKHANN